MNTDSDQPSNFTLASSTPSHLKMSTSPHPRCFITRSDGIMTPLIAVDELPNYVRIVGVSATMTPAETQGMLSLGVISRSEGRYIVQAVNPTPGLQPQQTSAPHRGASGQGRNGFSAPDVSAVGFTGFPAADKVHSSSPTSTDEKDATEAAKKQVSSTPRYLQQLH